MKEQWPIGLLLMMLAIRQNARKVLEGRSCRVNRRLVSDN